MKTRDYMILIFIGLLLLGCIALPYLQGSYNRVAIVLSSVIQILGFIGMVFVPVGIIGLAVNGMNKSRSTRLNFNLAIVALVLGALLYITINAFLVLNGDYKAATLTFLLGLFVAYKAITTLMHRQEAILYPRLFVYLLVLPLVAFFGRKVLVLELAEHSRNVTIAQASVWIEEIEQFKNATGNYPASLSELKTSLPQPEFMGIDNFNYENANDTYNLSFVQWVDMGAVQEVVVYSNSDTYNMRGHFASYHANEPHWKYFWLD